MSEATIHHTRDLRWWPPYALLFLEAVLAGPLTYIVTAREQAANPPNCFGIGWGCTPDPGTSAALVYYFVIPALLVGILLLLALGAFGSRTRPARFILSIGPALLMGLALLLA